MMCGFDAMQVFGGGLLPGAHVAENPEVKVRQKLPSGGLV
jgi:hypothetical protein